MFIKTIHHHLPPPVHLKSQGDKPPGASGGWVPRSGGAHQQGARPVHDLYVPVAAARVTETVDSLPDAEIKSGQFPANVSLDTKTKQLSFSHSPGLQGVFLFVCLSLNLNCLSVCQSTRQSTCQSAYMPGWAPGVTLGPGED